MNSGSCPWENLLDALGDPGRYDPKAPWLDDARKAFEQYEGPAILAIYSPARSVDPPMIPSTSRVVWYPFFEWDAESGRYLNNITQPKFANWAYIWSIAVGTPLVFDAREQIAAERAADCDFFERMNRRLTRHQSTSLLPIGSRVIASCPSHNIHDMPGHISAYNDDNPGHGEYIVSFDHITTSGYGCNAADVRIA